MVVSTTPAPLPLLALLCPRHHCYTDVGVAAAAVGCSDAGPSMIVSTAPTPPPLLALPYSASGTFSICSFASGG